jgi:hypothetical protein
MTSIENNTNYDVWRHHISQWQASGLSQASYCRQQALLAHQFSYWKRKFLADREPVTSEPKAGFARVQVAAHVATPSLPGLSLCFRDGTQLTGITQNDMALLIQATVLKIKLNRIIWIPFVVLFRDGIENGQQLPHASHQSNFFGFATRQQPVIKGLNQFIEADGAQGCHVQD